MAELRPSGIITLLTDFGSKDPFVGVMKGAILSRFPGATLVDLTHAIDPHDIAQGSFWLEKSYRWFPPGTVHVGVVDPGVGTRRSAIVVSAGGYVFVGPDNGLLAPAAEAAGGAVVHAVDTAQLGLPKPSDTFHGRDVFAPVAALIAAGHASPASVGPERTEWVGSRLPRAERTSSGIAGTVVAIDHFGNLITNVEETQLVNEPLREVRIAGKVLPVGRTYGEAERGQWLALIGSFGTVEIAVREGHAASVLGVRTGTPVEVITGRAELRAG